MQNRFVADIGDYVKLSILRALSPGYRLGVAWWLYPDEDHNQDGRHIGYLSHPKQWQHFDPDLFDALVRIVSYGKRDVRALEAANLLPGAIFASELIPTTGPTAQRRQARHTWLQTVQKTLSEADLLFVDPDNGLEPVGYRHGSSKAGKSITLDELRALARPGRCLIIYHHHTRRAGGHHAEIEYWADRLRGCRFDTVDALRARPYSPRVFFLLDAPPDVRQRAEKIAEDWQGLITWHPDSGRSSATSSCRLPPVVEDVAPWRSANTLTPTVPLVSGQKRSGRSRAGATTQISYVNRNGQEVIRAISNSGTDHAQYVYVLRCWTCGHEYGANGSDIWLRRCPAHDRGAPGLPI